MSKLPKWKTTEKLNLCLFDHCNRQQRGSDTKRPFQRFCPPNHKRKSNTRVKRIPMMVRWRCIRLTKDFSGWRSTIAFLYFFLFRSLLRLTFLLSPKQAKRKTNFGLPIETHSRMLDRLSRSTRQHPRQSLSFCSVIDLEAHFDKTWRRSSVNKLACTTGFLKANLQLGQLCLSLSTGIHAHWVAVDGPITMLKWTWHCRRPQNQTENFVQFAANRDITYLHWWFFFTGMARDKIKTLIVENSL